MNARPQRPEVTESAADAPAVDVEQLSRAFGTRKAVAGVSFRVSAGECLVLFGPNGAGKTTLLRILAGLIKPTGGAARIGGLALPGGAAVRSRIGLISHQSMLYDALTAHENVTFAARLHGLGDPEGAARRALDRLRVADRADTPVRLLSRGLQQRVAIARAIVHGPRVLLADEPYSGLDAIGAAALTSLLRELRAGGSALVVVTHNVVEGLALASHAAIMSAGSLIRHDPSDALDAAAYAARYVALLTGDAA